MALAKLVCAFEPSAIAIVTDSPAMKPEPQTVSSPSVATAPLTKPPVVTVPARMLLAVDGCPGITSTIVAGTSAVLPLEPNAPTETEPWASALSALVADCARCTNVIAELSPKLSTVKLKVPALLA